MKRLSEYIYFVHSHHETQDKCILKGVLSQNSPPHDPLKYHTVRGVNSPSKSHVCPNITNDTTLESSYALLLESAINLQICKNCFLQNPAIK